MNHKHKHKLKRSIFAMASLFIAAGCGNDSNDDNIADKVNEIDSNLTGTWREDCRDVTWVEVSKMRDTYDFTLVGDFTRKMELFANTTCAEPVYGHYNVSGTYIAGKKLDNDQREINFNITAMAFVPDNADLVKALNTITYCGKSDWALGQEVDLLNKNCAGEDIASGESIADIYKIADDKLFLGASFIWLDGKDASDRPTAVNADHPYAKK